MKVRLLVLPFVVALFIGFPPLSSFAQEKGGPITCEGDIVEYFQAEKKLVGRGNVTIRYKDMRLVCDEAIVYLEEKKAEVSGNVTLYEYGSVFQAEKVSYNFETEKGTLIEGSAKVEGELATRFWHAKAEEVEKVRVREYHLHHGYITTCDLDPPHYRIQSKKIKVYLDDKVTATHTLLFIGNCPVFYLPYYSHSLKDDRPRVTLIPGHSKEWGAYLLSRWGYYLNENSKGYINLDWMEKRGYAEGLDYMYRTRGFGNGALRIYYLDDLDKQDPLEVRNERERYLGQLRHRWEIDQGTLLLAEWHKLKDKDVVKDFFEKEYQKEPQPESFVSVTRSRSNYSLMLEVKKRMNRFFSVVERLPELSLDTPKLRLAGTKFYFQNQSSLANLNNKIVSQVGTGADDISLTEDRDAVRLDTYNQLSYVTRLLGWLDVTPYVGARETWYSKDTAGDEDLERHIWYSGLDLSTRFYRLYDVKSDFWHVDKLRHLVEPSISYNYIHEPTVGTSRILQFDSVDEITDKNAITLTLESKLQTKRSVGDKERVIDLVDLVVSTDYFPEEDEISNIDLDLKLKPFDWLRLEADTSYNYYRKVFETANVDLGLSRRRWRLGLGHRYVKDESSLMTGELSYEISPKWKLRCYQRYEFTTGELQEQEYSLQRDLHCWIGEIAYNIKDAGTIWVVFRLKAFPEMPFQFRTTYHGPK